MDRDFREDAEVDYLRGISVYVLDSSELENLLLTEDVLRFVSEQLHRSDFADLFEKTKALVLGEMERNKERLISTITAARIERKLKSFDAKVIGESNLKSSLDKLTKTIDVIAIYQNTRIKIEEILTNKKYDEAIRIYNHKGL